MAITCGANGTQDGVIESRASGAARCAIPAVVKNAARIQRITARRRENVSPGGRSAPFAALSAFPGMKIGCSHRHVSHRAAGRGPFLFVCWAKYYHRCDAGLEERERLPA